MRDARLAFSSDGRVLHALGETPRSESSEAQHVRAVTYDATTGVVLHTINLAPGTMLYSTTSDGRAAVIAAGIGSLVQLSLVDTETGKTQQLPSWNDGENDGPNAALSGDGHLISIYSESGTADHPMKVTVYAWPARTLVASQTSEFIAAGGSFDGGVTPNGRAIEFKNNRVGSELVDLKAGRKMASFGPDTVLSPSGDWAIEMPNLTYLSDDAPRKVLIKDGSTGRTRGRINVPVPDEIAYGQMTGAFCGESGRFILASGKGASQPTRSPRARCLPVFLRQPGAIRLRTFV